MKSLAVIVKKASVYQKLISTVNLLEKLIKKMLNIYQLSI